MKGEGYYVVCADWKQNEYMAQEDFCDEFLLLDLRELDNCLRATKGCELVFNLAADMGGYVLLSVYVSCISAVLEWASSNRITPLFCTTTP